MYSSSQDRLNTEFILQLYKEFDNLCFQYKVKGLERPLITINHSQSTLGSWNSDSKSMSFNPMLLEAPSWDVVVEVLKHEMAHQMVTELFGDLYEGHGTLFQKACDRLGVCFWARKASIDWKSVQSGGSTSRHTVDHPVLRKIKKLMELSGSSNEHEASIAMKTALRLQRKYNIESHGKLSIGKIIEDYSYLLISHGKKRFERFQVDITSLLVAHYFVDIVFCSVWDKNRNTKVKGFEIIGLPENILIAEHVYHYLNYVVGSLWKQYKNNNAISGKLKGSFQTGIVKGFRTKLSDSNRESSVGDSEQQMRYELQALQQSKLDLSQYLKYRHPRLSTRSQKGGKIYRDAFSDGVRTGKSISIRSAVTRASNRIGGYLT